MKITKRQLKQIIREETMRCPSNRKKAINESSSPGMQNAERAQGLYANVSDAKELKFRVEDLYTGTLDAALEDMPDDAAAEEAAAAATVLSVAEALEHAGMVYPARVLYDYLRDRDAIFNYF
jgi:hypothetical protein